MRGAKSHRHGPFSMTTARRTSHRGHKKPSKFIRMRMLFDFVRQHTWPTLCLPACTERGPLRHLCSSGKHLGLRCMCALMSHLLILCCVRQPPKREVHLRAPIRCGRQLRAPIFGAFFLPNTLNCMLARTLLKHRASVHGLCEVSCSSGAGNAGLTNVCVRYGEARRSRVRHLHDPSKRHTMKMCP